MCLLLRNTVNRGRPVTEVIWDRLPNTLLLMLASEIVIIIGALVIGLYSALRQYSYLDNAITTATFILYSMPVFFFALGAMYIFAVNFKRWELPYLPTDGTHKLWLIYEIPIGATLTSFRYGEFTAMRASVVIAP